MEFDIQAIFFVSLVSIVSAAVALAWLSMRQPSYDEVAASQSHKFKFFDSLGSSKKKEKIDKKGKKDKAKLKGKKKETSEDEEITNHSDEHSAAADNSPIVRKHKQQDLNVEPPVTPKAAELQQAAAVKSPRETPAAPKSSATNEKSKTSPAAESQKAAKTKSELAGLAKDGGESSKDSKSDNESKNTKKEKKKAKQGENLSVVKGAENSASAVTSAIPVSGQDGASTSGKKPTKEHVAQKPVEEKIEAQRAQHEAAQPVDGKKKTADKKKKAETSSNSGAADNGNIGQEGMQWVQSVTQMELSADQKNILDDVLLQNKSPKAKNNSQKHEDKPAAGAGALNAENEQLKAMVAKLRQDVGEERRKYSELEKQTKHLATEAAHVPQLVNDSKTLRLQIEGLTRQQNDAVLAVQRLREENRQLKEAGAAPRADDGTKMQLKMQMEEMSKLTLRLNTADNAKHNLEAKAARLEEQLQQNHLEKLETERLLREDMSRMQLQCQGSAKDIERYQMQLRKAHQDCEKLQHERDAAWQQLELNKEAEKKLQSALSDRLSSDDLVKQLRERNHELEVERQKHEAELLQLTEVNVKLNADFSAVRQKIVDLEKQVAESAKQQVSEHVQHSAGSDDDEKRRIQQLSSDVSRLQAELEQQKEKNKDLRARNGKALDALRNTEDIVRKVYREKEAVEEQLKAREKGSKIVSRDTDSKSSQLQSELKQRVTELDNKSKEILKLREEVSSLTHAKSQADGKFSELQSHLHQKDGDVKNLQATVDSLQKQLAAEKKQAQSQDIQSKLAEAESRLAQRQSEIDNLKSVITSLEKAAKSTAESTKPSDDLSERLSVTEQENGALLAQVAQYKTVLESTEGILKKLQASVETEERLWKEKVENAESVLQQIRSDNQALEVELNTLRATHEQTQTELGRYKSQTKQNGSV